MVRMAPRGCACALGLGLDSRSGKALRTLVRAREHSGGPEFVSRALGVFPGSRLCNEPAVDFAFAAKALAGVVGFFHLALARRSRVGQEAVFRR